ncbi:MAG TPA: thiosulfate reductase [Sedimenticola sp.]|nr:thiosulfate reductase [Sedimenticola sp.]
MNKSSRDALKFDRVWLALLGLTLGGTLLGESGYAGFWITLGIALVTLLKGRLVIDGFMELGGASPVIRRVVGLFGLLVPLLMVVAWLWEALARAPTGGAG